MPLSWSFCTLIFEGFFGFSFSLSCYSSLYSTLLYYAILHHTPLYTPYPVLHHPTDPTPLTIPYPTLPSTQRIIPYSTLPHPTLHCFCNLRSFLFLRCLHSCLLSTLHTSQPSLPSLPLPCRQRPALGKCLAAFSAAFPVAFLEHQINRFNSFSIYNSRGAKDRAGTRLCACICHTHTHSVIEFQHLGSWADRLPWSKCSLSFLFMHFVCSLTQFTAAVSFFSQL